MVKIVAARRREKGRARRGRVGVRWWGRVAVGYSWIVQC